MSVITRPTEDLTRWNRAGLTRLHYVDGNAATYLEDLRLALRTQFAGDEDVLSWLGENLTDKNLREWQLRLLAQYGTERRDYAWEILRTFARASHVLAQTINAHSNERYIRTATQWDNLRRLVNMLDYHPAPPASAETWVALFAKTKEAAIGKVEKGLALQNQPKDGTSPLIFETLEDIDVDYRLNELRAPNYNRSVSIINIPAQNGLFNFTPAELFENISVGDRGLIVGETLAGVSVTLCVSVSAVASNYLSLNVIEQGFTATSLCLADIHLQLAPSWQNTPRLNDTNVVQVNKVNSAVSVGNLLVYASGASWIARKVLALDGDRLKLDGSVPANTTLYQTLAVNAQYVDGSNRFVLPRSRASSNVWTSSGTATSVSTQNGSSGSPLYDYLAAGSSTQVFYLATNTPAAFTVINASATALQFSGKPVDLSSNDGIILQQSSGLTRSFKVMAVETFDGGYSVTTTPLLPPAVEGNGWVFAEASFNTRFNHQGYNQNIESIFHNETATSSQITLDFLERPDSLNLGRALWVVGPEQRQLVTVREIISQDGNQYTLSVKPSLQNLNLPKYATVIYANVVKAGHGETRGQSVLGNGNRIEKNQQFIYEKTGIAFEQDANFASGVRAGITVIVEDRVWTQVDNLRDSESADTHFSTSLNEDQQLLVRFGDGIHGQRLPTGTNNVVIRARFGSGVAGNLAAASINKLKKPVTLVDGVLQPSASFGGGDMEAAESIRELAPASVLTLERAVSIEDYAHIAQRHSSIWQARSYALPDTHGAVDRVEVVLVPDGGGDLGDLKLSMKSYLENFSRPGVMVAIAGYEAILLELNINLRVDISAFDGDKVTEAVRLSLVEAFSLQKAKLGESIYLSRVYQVIEAVEGVENVDLLVNPDGFVDELQSATTPADVFYGDDHTVRRITPTNRQLIYIESSLRAPQITWEAADV
jgi:predicted phage baseplate assembly protein